MHTVTGTTEPVRVAAMVDIKSLLLQVFSIIGCQSTEEIETENELLRIQSIVREVFDKSLVDGVVTCRNTQIDEFAELQMPKVQVLSHGSSDLRPFRLVVSFTRL